MDNNELLKLFSIFSSKNASENKSNADKIISGLDSSKKAELNSILNDRQKINEILSSPAAKKIIDKLNGNS